MCQKCCFCQSIHTETITVRKKEYMRCRNCGGILLLPQFCVSKENQRSRYLQHENTLENSGYLSFLKSFIEPVFDFLHKETSIVFSQILDYGSGPVPCLVQYLKQCAMQSSEAGVVGSVAPSNNASSATVGSVCGIGACGGSDVVAENAECAVVEQRAPYTEYSAATSGVHVSGAPTIAENVAASDVCVSSDAVRLENSHACSVLYPSLAQNADIRGWDPFFAPDTSFFFGGAELVLCLEVAEHFENPQKDFASLARACKKDGYIAVGTMLLMSSIQFETWWYKDDCTHTAFYTADSLAALGAQNGLRLLMQTNRLCIFKKTV